MQKNKNNFILLVVTTLLLLTACGDSGHLRQLQQYVTKLKQDAEQKTNNSVIKGFDAPPAVVYDAKDLRSPFESTNSQSATANTFNPTHPLEAYPITVLRFKGTATEGNKVWAFIQTPDNKLFQVTQGDNIGDHHGKITQVTTTEIEIQEPIDQTAVTGKSSTRIVTLRLKDASQ